MFTLSLMSIHGAIGYMLDHIYSKEVANEYSCLPAFMSLSTISGWLPWTPPCRIVSPVQFVTVRSTCLFNRYSVNSEERKYHLMSLVMLCLQGCQPDLQQNRLYNH